MSPKAWKWLQASEPQHLFAESTQLLIYVSVCLPVGLFAPPVSWIPGLLIGIHIRYKGWSALTWRLLSFNTQQHPYEETHYDHPYEEIHYDHPLLNFYTCAYPQPGNSTGDLFKDQGFS